MQPTKLMVIFFSPFWTRFMWNTLLVAVRWILVRFYYITAVLLSIYIFGMENYFSNNLFYNSLPFEMVFLIISFQLKIISCVYRKFENSELISFKISCSNARVQHLMWKKTLLVTLHDEGSHTNHSLHPLDKHISYTHKLQNSTIREKTTFVFSNKEEIIKSDDIKKIQRGLV